MAPAAGNSRSLLVAQRTHALRAHLQHDAGTALRRDDRLALAERLHHRLLEVDGLLRLEGIDGHLPVPVIGRRDDDGIDVGPRQDLAVVAGGEELLPPTLFRLVEPSGVEIAHGHQLDAGHAKGRGGVSHALDARADERELHAVVGWGVLPGCGLHLRARERFEPSRRREGCATGQRADESSARRVCL
jgi:hypothetical protein